MNKAEIVGRDESGLTRGLQRLRTSPENADTQT